MARFLSVEWVDEFNAALDGVVLPDPGPDAGLGATSGHLTVMQEIGGTPEGDVRLVLRIDGGILRLHRSTPGEDTSEDGAADPGGGDPDVSIALSYEDAAALSTGELSPAEALTAGRIRVRGDLAVLVAAQQALGQARSSTGSLAAVTTY